MSGWNIYSGNSSTSITDGINNMTGVLTYGHIVTEQCFGSYEDGYKIEFEDFDNETHTFTINPGDCVECNMFVTWFKAGNPIYPLNASAQTQFDVKNVDDCKKVIRTKDPRAYGFINGTITTEPFNDTSYTDEGTLLIYSQSGFGEGYEMVYDKSASKYPSGSLITNTHKISYHVVEEPTTTELKNCISGNTKLKEIFIPSGITSIGEGAFSNNPSLSAITTVGVQTINNNSFCGCTSLTEVNLNNRDAFKTNGCNTNVGSLETIGANAFSGCSSIVNLEIPSSVTSISSGAFSDCSGIKRLVVPFRALTNSSEFSFGFGTDEKVGVVVTGTKYGTIDSNVFSGKDVYLYFAEITTADIDFNLPANAHTYGEEKWEKFKGACEW